MSFLAECNFIMVGQREAILLLDASLEVDLILFGNEIVHGTRYLDVLSVRPRVSREENWLRVSKNIFRRIIGKHNRAEREREREEGTNR